MNPPSFTVPAHTDFDTAEIVPHGTRFLDSSSSPFITPDRRPDILDRLTSDPIVSLESLMDPVRLGELPGTADWCLTDGSEGSEGKESKEGKDGSDGTESGVMGNLANRSLVLTALTRTAPMM